MMKNSEWIEIYKTDMIRCVRCGTLKIVGERLASKANLGFGCCVPFEVLPYNWGTSDAPQWILDLRN